MLPTVAYKVLDVPKMFYANTVSLLGGFEMEVGLDDGYLGVCCLLFAVC